MSDAMDEVCHCGHASDDHHNEQGECMDDDCDCIAYERDYGDDDDDG